MWLPRALAQTRDLDWLIRVSIDDVRISSSESTFEINEMLEKISLSKKKREPLGRVDTLCAIELRVIAAEDILPLLSVCPFVNG